MFCLRLRFVLSFQEFTEMLLEPAIFKYNFVRIVQGLSKHFGITTEVTKRLFQKLQTFLTLQTWQDCSLQLQKLSKKNLHFIQMSRLKCNIGNDKMNWLLFFQSTNPQSNSVTRFNLCSAWDFRSCIADWQDYPA